MAATILTAAHFNCYEFAPAFLKVSFIAAAFEAKSEEAESETAVRSDAGFETEAKIDAVVSFITILEQDFSLNRALMSSVVLMGFGN